MKQYYLVILLLFSCLTLFAQNKQSEVKKMFWGKDDLYANARDIPEKWTKESAVVIYQEFSYQYEGTVRSVDYRESTRRRIKLLDKSAVDAYSEFSFAERFQVEKGFYGKGGRVYAGVKVIKSDGSETEIDMADAVEVRSGMRETLKKIAIPDLEVGDIIDYYYYIYEPFITLGEYIFDPIISPLSGSFPIVKQKLEFKVGKDFFINFKSLNGAPELKVQDDSQKKKVIYSLLDEDREKSEELRWYFPRRVEPIIKFQVVYARKAKLEKAADAFLGEKEQVKNKVDAAEVLSFFQTRYSFGSSVKSVLGHLKKKNLSNAKADRLAMLREAYYFFRYENLIAKIEPIFFIQEGYLATWSPSYRYFLDDDGFVEYFGSFLKKQNFDFDVIVAVPRTISDIESLLLRDEITLLLRVNLEEPIYLSRFGLHTSFNQIPEELEGVNAYELRVNDKYKMTEIATCRIPSSTCEDNQTRTAMTVRFSEDNLNLLDVQRACEYNGHNKSRMQSDLLFLYDYLEEEYDYFGVEPFVERGNLKSRSRETVREKVKAKKAEEAEKQLEMFEANINSDLDFPVKEYGTYELKKMGRLKEDLFAFEESFQLEGLVKRAGKNYILEAGKLIGGQVALMEKELERKVDIYMPFPRSFVNNITIELPEGYGVEGLDKLNKQVENATGGFVSTASLEAGKLNIKTFKYYKNNFEKAERWPDLVDFLEASFKFTQEKVLLKKQ